MKKIRITGNFLPEKYVIRVKVVFAYEELIMNNYPSSGTKKAEIYEGDRI